MKKLFIKYACVFLFAILVYFSSAYVAEAQDPFPNCRLGVAGVYSPYVGDYNIAQLNTGRYLDWGTRSNPVSSLGLPAGVEYIQTVRVHQKKVGGWDSEYVDPPAYTVSPNLTTIANNATSQPGAIWLIGNEMERRDWNGGGQDEITPELYAIAFHEIQAVIKTADPTAKIAIGGVIQATPLRLEYLDRVWDAYFTEYGYPMGNDIDVWNVHGFILREIRGEWGADIPAGLNYQGGFLSSPSLRWSDYVAAHYSITYYRQFFQAFRTWMADHGERNKPLLNTEYGPILDPNSTTQMTNFMADTFNYMFTKTDNTIGYPADKNRLVQGWVWYSLNDDFTNQPHFAGSLFNSTTHQLTAVGGAWRSYVSNPANPLASQPQQNLLVTNLRTQPALPSVLPGGVMTITLKADIANSGNSPTSTGNNIVVRFWDGVPGEPGSTLIASPQLLADLPGCGRWTTAEVAWPNRGVGDHSWYVQVVPIATETDTTDNVAGEVVSVMEGIPTADLKLSKTVNNPTPYTDSTIEYTVVVTNHGPHQATNVIVNDLLPAGVTFESYKRTQGNYSKQSGQWALGNLANQATAILTITARVDAGQGGHVIVNDATATTETYDPTTDNDTGTIAITPIANADTAIFVTSQNTPEAIIFTLVANNYGPDSATAVVVKNFLLPTGLIFDSYTATQGSYNNSTGVWGVGSLAGKLQATLTVTATVEAGHTHDTFIINNINISADEDDLEPGNNVAAVTATLLDNLYLPLIIK